MAKKRFLVVEDSFIQMRLIRADMPVAQRIVEIETDPEQGGMTPSGNLVECDEEGNPLVAAAAKSSKTKRTASAHNDGTGGAAGAPNTGDAKDLA